MKKAMIRFWAGFLLVLFFFPVFWFTGLRDAEAVDLVLTPYNPPIMIQEFGGSFDYTIDVLNNEADDLLFNLWTMIALPDGREVGLLFEPVFFRLPTGWTASRTLSQFIPETVPSGNYFYTAYVGRFPDTVWVSDSFSFEKLTGVAEWYPQNSGTANYLIGVYFSDPSNGWAVGSLNTILHTVNGGDSWYEQASPTSSNYYDVCFANALEGWAVGSAGKIIHTTDGGEIWSNQSSGTSYAIYGIFCQDANTAWVVGGKERSFTEPNRFIRHTTDGGATWNTQYSESGPPHLESIFFVNALDGYAVGEGGGILKTTDGGISWVLQDSGILGHLYSVFFTDPLTGWAVGVSGVVLNTVNGGDSWFVQDVGTTNALRSVFFADASTGWIIGGNNDNSTVLHTSDGGLTWLEQNGGTNNFLAGAHFTDALNGWAVGINGTIVHTTTGGE